MKKFFNCIFTVVSLAAISLMLTSCGKKTATFDDLPELPPPVGAETEAAAPSYADNAASYEDNSGVVVPDHLQTKETGLRSGIWYAYSKTGSSYYCFYQGKNSDSGVKISVADGIISPFKYEKREKYYLFHFGKEDDNTTINVEYKSDGRVEFEINGTYYETLEYVADKNYNEFMFYTNEELFELAREHYAKNVANPRLAKIMQANIIERSESKVTVQLTKQEMNKLTEEVETVVCASYTVSRITCKGVDGEGNDVDISS